MLLCVFGSYFAKFETGQTFSVVQMDASTPNTVGPTMFCCIRLHVTSPEGVDTNKTDNQTVFLFRKDIRGRA